MSKTLFRFALGFCLLVSLPTLLRAEEESATRPLDIREVLTGDEFVKMGFNVHTKSQIKMINEWLTRYTQEIEAQTEASILERVNAKEKAAMPPIPETIAGVYLFPEKFVGKTLVFDKVGLDPEVKRDEGYFMVGVRGKAKSTFDMFPTTGGFAFMLSEHMAKRLTAMNISQYTTVQSRITCRMRSGTAFSSKIFMAYITKLEIYNKGGSIHTTLTDK